MGFTFPVHREEISLILIPSPYVSGPALEPMYRSALHHDPLGSLLFAFFLEGGPGHRVSVASTACRDSGPKQPEGTPSGRRPHMRLAAVGAGKAMKSVLVDQRFDLGGLRRPGEPKEPGHHRPGLDRSDGKPWACNR